MTQSNTGGSPIKRYTLVRGGMDHQDMMCVRPDGKWVRHEDHAAEVLALRAAAQRYLAANDAYDEYSKTAMDEWRAARMALMEALSQPDSGEGA